MIPGVVYPRDVPMPECMPPGWKAIEKAYGVGSLYEGHTYISYHSLDGKYKHLLSTKQVYMAHCGDLGIPWEPEYAKYEAAKREKHDREAEVRAKEREERIAKREELIALSRQHFGEITGAMTLGFPGWKCRWDYSPKLDKSRELSLHRMAASGSFSMTSSVCSEEELNRED